MNDNTADLPRIRTTAVTDACRGRVRWAPMKSLWLTGHAAVVAVLGWATFGWDTLAVFVITTAVTLCLGHSLGMHRLLIHRSYRCPRWLELTFLHCGTLVGMAGPMGMLRTHDLRDWAQRQPDCHAYLRHGEGFWRDGWWQLHCELELEHPPAFVAEAALREDRAIQFMDRTWMLQQLPLAALLFMLGGIGWVVWGICARVLVSVSGHWLVGYFAHNSGGQDHVVDGAAVQGHNVAWMAVLTMGESWHNNHHAFPGSALLGLYADQADPGWRVLVALHNLGLVWDIVLPQDLPKRAELRPVTSRAHAGVGDKGPTPCPVLGALS